MPQIIVSLFHASSTLSYIISVIYPLVILRVIKPHQIKFSIQIVNHHIILHYTTTNKSRYEIDTFSYKKVLYLKLELKLIDIHACLNCRFKSIELSLVKSITQSEIHCMLTLTVLIFNMTGFVDWVFSDAAKITNGK